MNNTTQRLKPFEFGKWAAWQGTAQILLSDESVKQLREFETVDACVNWLFVNGHKEAARALNAHAKLAAVPVVPVVTSSAYFDRFDICEAHYILESDYNVGGILKERPSNQRRNMSSGFQLSRMGFKPSPNLSFETLTENGQEIYNDLVKRYNLPE